MATDDAILILRSIDASLKQLVKQLRTAQPPEVASDRELDGEWGNPLVKFNPRDWTGDSMKGARFSQCPAPFLDMLAETFDYFARDADAKGTLSDKGKAVAPYKRADAARARGWAKRVREGKVVPPMATTPTNGNGAGSTGWGDEPDDKMPEDWS